MNPMADMTAKLPGTTARAAVIAALCALAACGNMGATTGLRLAASLKSQGLLAGALGEGLTDSARTRAADAEYRALEAGQTGAPVVWKATDSVYGSVVPQQPFSVGPANCRRYSHSVTIGGQNRVGSGTACRQEDGSWRPLS